MSWSTDPFEDGPAQIDAPPFPILTEKVEPHTPTLGSSGTLLRARNRALAEANAEKDAMQARLADPDWLLETARTRLPTHRAVYLARRILGELGDDTERRIYGEHQ